MRGWLARSLLRTSGADAHAAVGGVASIWSRPSVVDIDEHGGVLDVVLHQVDEIGAAAEELRAAAGDGLNGSDREWWRAGR